MPRLRSITEIGRSSPMPLRPIPPALKLRYFFWLSFWRTTC